MSYLVLALGGLLALCGAVALFTSYGIIMVERGWAGVIAGTTALASGVVTIALGLILHRLSGLYALLAGTSGHSAEEEAGEPSPAQAPRYFPKAAIAAEAGPDAAAAQPASGWRSWRQRQARSVRSPGRNVLKPRAPGAPSALRLRETVPGSESENAGAAVQRAETGLGPATAAARTEVGIEQDSPPGPAPFDETHKAGEDRRRAEPGPGQDAAGEEPFVLRPFATMPIPAGEAAEPPWTDGSWPAEPAMIETIVTEAAPAAFPPETGNETVEPLPESREAAGLEPPADTFAAAAEAYHPAEAGIGDVRSPDDTIGGETVGIVGRYESEGASFVRYADGSIEARTDHAVFHFKSMDEFKRFMESQAQAPKE